ncbi:hypothetical protein Uis1B_1880 [Bifidobacterium margollesii]|uniref:Uncharacterized protein n=1 Tax=Bifidobacterium margollesii TaxID=2020964 RepID=A0A2N5J7U0_9BIFI|nr:hypothetical protein Uis1B_1880 [Bifidobacterium margollesii]
MANKNIFGSFIDYCADNLMPAAIAQEKMAEAQRRNTAR